jgi:hypothetical protein
MLMSHVLAEGQFDRWLERFLPQLAYPAWRELKPVPKPQNSADYLQAHQSRLPLTRAIAWRSIAAASQNATAKAQADRSR